MTDGWFTEGFDTRDLQEAKALLEELEGQAKVAVTEKHKSLGKESVHTTRERLMSLVIPDDILPAYGLCPQDVSAKHLFRRG